MIARARSLQAAAEVFRTAGIQPVILGDTVTGEAREVAKVYASLIREIRAYNEPFEPPVALISGGECTVTLPPGAIGRGGRCTEFLLSLAVELEAMPNVYALRVTRRYDGTKKKPEGACSRIDQHRGCAWTISARCLDHATVPFLMMSKVSEHGPTRTNVTDYRNPVS